MALPTTKEFIKQMKLSFKKEDHFGNNDLKKWQIESLEQIEKSNLMLLRDRGGGKVREMGLIQEAQEYIDLYFKRYPGVKDYMDETKEKAKEQGYVETVFGRRLYLPEINSRNGQRRQYAERTAINAPMQGTAADIIKRAMIAVDHALAASKVEAKVVMQVHDELVVEVLEKDVEAVADLLRIEMEQAARLKVPLVVDIGIGDNWDEAH